MSPGNALITHTTMINSYTGNRINAKIGSYSELDAYKVMNTHDASCAKLYFDTEEEYEAWKQNGRKDLRTIEKEADQLTGYQPDIDEHCLDPDDDLRCFSLLAIAEEEEEQPANYWTVLEEEVEEESAESAFENLTATTESRRRGLGGGLLHGKTWADFCDEDDDEW